MSTNNVINSNFSYQTLRLMIGGLGILLPIILPIFNNWVVEDSISHFYYTKSSIVFTSVLFALGLFLFSYRGVERMNTKLSDNIITNLAGFCAMGVALIPKSYFGGNGSSKISQLKTYLQNNDLTIQFVHDDEIWGNCHNALAIAFFVAVGFMVAFRFVSTKQTKGRNIFYKVCGFGVWIALALTILYVLLGWKTPKHGVFIGETIALYFFGIAWFMKSGIFDKDSSGKSKFRFSP